MATAASATKTISIPKVERMKMIARIGGTRPLLVNRFNERKQVQIAESQTGKGKVKKEPRKPEQEFQEARYLLGGKDSYPGIAFIKAMVNAGGRFGGEKMTELRGVFFCPETFLEIINPDPKVKDWPRMREDIAWLQGKTPMPVYRPEYWPWQMIVPIIFSSTFLSLDQAINLLSLASTIGIGAWRPECDGTHGQWEVLDVKAEVLK